MKELGLNNFEQKLAGYAGKYYAYLPGRWWHLLFWMALPLYALQGLSARKMDGIWLVYGGWVLLFVWYFVLSIRVIGKLANIRQKTEVPSLPNAELSQSEQCLVLVATQQSRPGFHRWVHVFMWLAFPLFSWVFVLTPSVAIGTRLVGGLGIIFFVCYFAVSARVISRLSNGIEIKAAPAADNQTLDTRILRFASLLAYLLLFPFSIYYGITHTTAIKTSERIFEIGSMNAIFGGAAGYLLLVGSLVALPFVRGSPRKIVVLAMRFGAGMMIWAFWNLLLVGLVTGEIFTAANSFAN